MILRPAYDYRLSFQTAPSAGTTLITASFPFLQAPPGKNLGRSFWILTSGFCLYFTVAALTVSRQGTSREKAGAPARTPLLPLPDQSAAVLPSNLKSAAVVASAESERAGVKLAL